ncbi:GTP-binding protein [Clostridium sp. JS66]|uniref:GTP-binding protein n=1 Tax=Clostridium sp. JS66 TaxID=3064705 RepID=UPI00298D8C93|nr:GTP-binding protein [Clostridium sp. JS66]WPC43582.1 GTP-binding protein [Clostridium sp. JS66]
MNLIIFSGFLGSGKTSLILSLAHFIVESQTSKKPNLVIIENEVGDIGIDDKVLKSGGFSVRELFAGCICCQLTSDLIITLNDIKEKIDPKWVIIETTGLAYPGKILGNLNKYGKGIDSIKTVTVVDAERFYELRTVAPILIENQIAEGDSVLINKVDLTLDSELEIIEKDVKHLNEKANIYRVSASKNVDDCMWKKVVDISE